MFSTLSVIRKCRVNVFYNVAMNDFASTNNLFRSDLSKLSYVTMCIKEALRMYPPVHFIAKQLDEDIVFSHRFNGYKPITLKKGTNIGVNIFVLHRNPHIWENPEVNTFVYDNN